MQTKDSLDLMNVDYEDVLHIYRGWRKSESILKDKDKELTLLKNRINQLQDSHNRFRGQIQALESVKELTLSLQSQLQALQQENTQLVQENKELAELNLKAEELIKAKEEDQVSQVKMLRNVQIEFATLSGRYEETMKAQKELERITQQERSNRMILESRLHQTEETIHQLNDENKTLRSQLENAQQKLNQCDTELLHASEQLASITKEVVNINTTKEALVNAETEVSLLKGDITRLIRLFDAIPGSRDFFLHWEDSAAMTFVGMEYNPNEDEEDQAIYQPNHSNKISSFSESHHKMSETEFAHLKRVHGKDPFPLSSSLVDESEFWVPREAARLGVQFMSQRFPNASPKVIMDFLRSMNQIWLRRERRKIKRIKEVLGSDIEDLKRQLSNQKPYKGVLAERQIRRLQSQVKSDRKKSLTGRPRGKLEDIHKDHFAVEDMDINEMSGASRRYCKTEELRRSMEGRNRETVSVSTAKLLEASLTSLDNLSLRQSQTMHRPEDDIQRIAREASETVEGAYPSASYLRGALWIGRNLTLISEELGQALDQLRMRTLSDIQQVDQSFEQAQSQVELIQELKRGIHRLKILSTGTATQACALAGKSKNMARKILQGASELEVGDSDRFQAFLSCLPIESALLRSHATQTLQDSHQLMDSAPASPATRSRPNSRHSSPSNRSVSMRMSSLLDSPLYTADLINKY